MPITVNESGTLCELSEVWVNEGGTLYELDTVHSNESGTLYEIHSAWKPPDTLTWTAQGATKITPINNGYNCTITRSTSGSYNNYVAFTIKNPTKFTIKLDNYSSQSNIRIISWGLDGASNSLSGGSFSVSVETSGEHSLRITTIGGTVTFSITAEKI